MSKLSRKIDLTKALSDEDRQYLLDRGRHYDIAVADANAAGEEPPEQVSYNPTAQVGATEVPVPGAPQVAAVTDDTVTGTVTVDGAAAPVIETPQPEAVTATADDYDDEDEWEYRDLQDEAKERGLKASGKREDLVARLRRHDANQTADDDKAE